MFDAKKLTEEQVDSIKSWAAEGAQLADIQKRMEDEMEIRLTYMDTRFLVLDLGIELRNLAEEAKQKEAEEAAADPAQAGNADDLTEDDLEILPPTPQGSGAVRVTVDEIARPGVMASGRVTFADGNGGMWYVDEGGRLGIDPDVDGYRPTEADVLAFQRELQATMENR
ncbi:hypothetical protein JIN77_07440 [Verrucomicrobiaceae bacterium R5-34]|uniref:Uncharacterized protein n=1 Tax=Oceaniferula flava TaxID=2800421 RepID=A0AAE2SDQ0_9BACT|nr:hypothetical protein [Oceaniferula flavus]MBK1830554.1 hypothetical protein [Verrucomicrobiaceae bacterium R5-34]MBK1854650.1 hypothetical protein [Oceaniferula flavus]MBM1135956.1 hypothetical protein [Oceaniferula flavus]